MPIESSIVTISTGVMKASVRIYPFLLLATAFSVSANDTTIAPDANSRFNNVACMVEAPMSLLDYSCPRCETSPIGYRRICFDGNFADWTDGSCNVTVDLFPGITRHFIEWPRYEDGTCPDYIVCPQCPGLPIYGSLGAPCPYRLRKDQHGHCRVIVY